MKISRIQDLYAWLSGDFLSNLIEDSSLFNSTIRSSYANLSYFINDATSIVVGYPIIRQLRIMKSNLNHF